MKIGQNLSQIDYLKQFFKKYSEKDLINFLEQINNLKVLVIGEAIIDEYIYGSVIGKTNKSASLVFSPENTESFAGVPMNVANHLSTFCKSVDLLAMVGKDNKENFIKNHLNNVTSFFYLWDSKTITKKRYISIYNNSKVFEVYDYVPIKFDDNCLIEHINSNINTYDLIIVCDSGHGMLTYNVRKVLKDKAKFLAINTQMNAGNVGTHSVKKYIDRNHDIFICVNEREFMLATHDIWDKYLHLNDLLLDFNINTIAITAGSSGCKIARKNDIKDIPAFADNCVDPVGAGDAFLALSSPMAYLNYPLEIIGCFGNIAGALKMFYQGNKEYITKERVYNYIKELRERCK